MVQLDLSPLAEAMVLRQRHQKIQMMTLAPMEARLLNLLLQGQRLQQSRQLLRRRLLQWLLSRLLQQRRRLSQQLSVDSPESSQMLLQKNEDQWHKMESFLLVTSHCYRLLMITAQYFRLKSLLLVSAHYTDYCQLLPLLSIYSLLTVVMDRSPHHYCFITTNCWALLPLLPITSISLLLIATITTYYFHIKQSITASLLPHYPWIAFCMSITSHYSAFLP